jgi:hypothetical protein
MLLDRRQAAVCALALAAGACVTRTAVRPLFAPASEPRGTMRLAIDLPPAQRCAETFDLAIYQEPGIELVAWDDGPSRCAGRVIEVRYLPNKTTPERVTAAAVRAGARIGPEAKGALP